MDPSDTLRVKSLVVIETGLSLMSVWVFLFLLLGWCFLAFVFTSQHWTTFFPPLEI
jgi:hypothetical protein